MNRPISWLWVLSSTGLQDITTMQVRSLHTVQSTSASSLHGLRSITDHTNSHYFLNGVISLKLCFALAVDFQMRDFSLLMNRLRLASSNWKTTYSILTGYYGKTISPESRSQLQLTPWQKNGQCRILNTQGLHTLIWCWTAVHVLSMHT